MTGQKIINLAYLLSNTNSATFLDANETNIYEHLNTLYGHRILDILRVRVDKNASIQNSTTSFLSSTGLVKGDNGFNGEYTFPDDILRPVRVEVSYDGVNWKKCQIYDNAINQGSEYNETQINDDFSIENPRVDFFRNSYKIRPINTKATVENGVYIEYEMRQQSFTSTTSPAEIEANLQDVLAYDLAGLEFIMHPEQHSQEQAIYFEKKKREVEKRFLNHYKTRLGNAKKITFTY